jgi:hypothetical protein
MRQNKVGYGQNGTIQLDPNPLISREIVQVWRFNCPAGDVTADPAVNSPRWRSDGSPPRMQDYPHGPAITLKPVDVAVVLPALA